MGCTTDPRVTKRMRANRRRDTGPELALRRALFACGLRYRIDYPIRTDTRLVRPDVVFVQRRLAVFVDGCFWHCCPIHGNHPRHNASYWGPKLRRNVDRDRCVDDALSEAGWTVLRVWEHEEPQRAAARISAVVASR
jgi:DNA mismatch endonuclease (patch repair protein)